MSFVPQEVPDLTRFAIDVASRVNAGVWPAARGGRWRADLRRPARQDGWT